MQLSAISAAVPMETASAPSASAFAASTPFLIPPEMMTCTSPSAFISSSDRTASHRADNVGTPVWSRSASGDAPVAPSIPSITRTSAPAFTASFTSSETREAPIFT